MNSQRLIKITILTILGAGILALLAGCGLIGGGNQPADESRLLFQGVTYHRQASQSPRPMVAHIVEIDLRQKGLSFLVTPGDAKAELPLEARTTSGFLEEFDLQLAINGDGFTPWESSGLLTSYPKVGDPVRPNGLAASRGVLYAPQAGSGPTVYLSRTNKVRFNAMDGRLYNAISGDRMLIERGVVSEGLQGPAEPRTAMGLDRRGRKLILVVVDGRQGGTSQGATLGELARILLEHGAYYAMNLDGGGSSTLVMQGPDGRSQVLNSPIDNNLRGRERPVGNHLGVFAPPVE